MQHFPELGGNGKKNGSRAEKLTGIREEGETAVDVRV
jgi:hypothetical protein